jgi:hypothetical protein
MAQSAGDSSMLGALAPAPALLHLICYQDESLRHQKCYSEPQGIQERSAGKDP